jgi:hypothetical protein
MADDKPSKLYPPRWAMIYMLVLVLALIAWIILDVLHGVHPGSATGDRGIPRTTSRSCTRRARGASRLRFLGAAPSALVPLPGGTKAL